jgi:hypothetical protein
VVYIAERNNNQKENNDFMKYIYLFFFLTSFQIHVQAQLPSAANGKFATVNGKKIYYEEYGSGMPLLLFHGFGATIDFFLYIGVEAGAIGELYPKGITRQQPFAILLARSLLHRLHLSEK